MPMIPGSSRTSWCDSKRGFAGAALVLIGLAAPAGAEVRFGNNVFVGGHDFSRRTFDRHHRAIIKLYDRPIRQDGCVTRSDGHGGTVKSCRLRRR